MKGLPFRFALAFLGATLAAVPAWGQNREHQQMMADIRMLQEQTVRLHLVLGTLDQTLQTLLTRLDAQGDDVRRGFANQQLLIDSVATGVRVVREKVDENNVRVSSLAQEVEAVRMAMPMLGAPLTDLEVDPETGLPVNPGLAPVPQAPVNPGVSPQRLYDTAYTDYTTGQWALSIQGFEAYISTFPRSQLADDAQFFIGQNYYADGQFREAAEAYDQVVSSYPDGDVVAEALYKRGLTLERLDQLDLARETFQTVVREHPDDNMANLAQQALDRLD
jgi:tol-pal system protein YbgF